MVLLILSACNFIIFTIIDESYINAGFAAVISIDVITLLTIAFIFLVEYEDKKFYPTLYKFRRLAARNDRRMYAEFIKMCVYYVLK